MKNELQIKAQLIASKDFRRSLTRQSFYWFFPTYFRHYIHCESAPFHKEMFMLLQDPTIPKLAITAFRGSAKSTIVTLAYVIWSMIGAPQKKYILVISQTQELAKQILANIKAEFEDTIIIGRGFGTVKDKLIWGNAEEREWEIEVDILRGLVKDGLLTPQKANSLLPPEFSEKLPAQEFGLTTQQTKISGQQDQTPFQKGSDKIKDKPNNTTLKQKEPGMRRKKTDREIPIEGVILKDGTIIEANDIKEVNL